MIRRLLPKRLRFGEEATVVEHLTELRHRLLISIFAIVPAFVVAFIFHEQLIGCIVETRAGETVGRVVRVEGGAAASLLVVQGRRREVLVPLAEEICVSIDPGARRIVIEPPEGLLDLN